ncbi:Oidioi.mRNA.OKI2018_I69.XSR.g13355.t1.cds [Oikopleura dioica]|uniref:Oidioi.mRNA.OKI2018_I69.XSR.g13355.t1.cds n=1 Tax=Oikopleura dioica TaxID=34765 RepID=A0ABN7SAH6_OIKDI|nr:Oidioi.mRNA.OKI2018_I69.XSR.g13355.t1.cds [Oikopleura dioica]
MVETKENILDELTAKLGTLEALLDSLERNKAQRSPLPFTVGLPTPSTSDISSSSDFSTSSSKLGSAI